MQRLIEQRADRPAFAISSTLGLQSRAAAPGAASHGHQAGVLRESARHPRIEALPTPPSHAAAAARVRAPAGRRIRDRRGPATASASTTRRRGTACSSSDHALAHRGSITNAEYREFIDAGGYREPKLWLADGWAKLREPGWFHSAALLVGRHEPRVHARRAGAQLDPHAPVCHVSYYEADAFARWAGARLPTESRVGACGRARRRSRATCSMRATCNRSRRPRTRARGIRSAALWRRLGVVRVELRALPRLHAARGLARRVQRQVHVQPARGARRVVRHVARTHPRPTYRSFFYPHDRWQFLGFRLAKNP